jgi:hypothetical protein
MAAFDADLRIARRHDAHMFSVEAMLGYCRRGCVEDGVGITTRTSWPECPTLSERERVARVLAALSHPCPANLMAIGSRPTQFASGICLLDF